MPKNSSRSNALCQNSYLLEDKPLGSNWRMDLILFPMVSQISQFLIIYLSNKFPKVCSAISSPSLLKTEILGSEEEVDDSLIIKISRLRLSVPRIREVVCVAPFWNQTGWMNNSVPITVIG